MTIPRTKIRKRSVTIAGHRTSVSLEQGFWLVLEEIARHKGKSVTRIISEVDHAKKSSLSAALRIFILDHLMQSSSAFQNNRMIDDYSPT